MKRPRWPWLALLFAPTVAGSLLMFAETREARLFQDASPFAWTTVFCGYLFVASIIYNLKDGIRGWDLVTPSIALAALLILANTVILAAVGFAGCVCAVSHIGRAAP